ncbi:MAG: MXAN_5187 C-terminal domain-containing protein [Polyangiales bacterium]
MAATTDEIQLALDELETRLDRLRALYEQYFTGIEKAVPAVQHKDVERRIQTLRKASLRNTAQRFRFQTLIQKYTTYLQYWQRILRRIEEGTHKRDLARAARYGVRPKKASSSDGVYELDPDAIEDYDDVDAVEEVEAEPTTEERAPLHKPAAVVQPAATARQVEVLPFDVVEAPVRNVLPSVAPKPATAAQPTPVASTVSTPATPAASVPAPAQPAAQAKRPGLSVFGVAQKGAGPTTTAQPALSKPAAQPAPAASIPAPAQPAALTQARPAVATTPSGGATRPTSTDAALRQLYERYRDARKQNGEAEVDFDVVARQVRDTLPKLREKYPGQNVELDVSVKDGRTILRPVVKPKK